MIELSEAAPSFTPAGALKDARSQSGVEQHRSGPTVEKIDDRRVGHAIDLLAKGFPKHPSKFWEDSLARVQSLSGNTATGLPCGLLLIDGRTPVGVALTLGAERRSDDGRVIRRADFGAWYIEPSHRLQAGAMMRELVRLPVDVVTDLTPSPAVQRILPLFGFKPITRGVSFNLTAIAALKQDKATVCPLGESSPIANDVKQMLLTHATFGCVPALLSTDHSDTALMFRLTRWRGLPAARVVYAGSTAALHAHVGAVSRFLLRLGIAGLFLDLPLAGRVPGLQGLGRRLRFARGPVDLQTIDYAETELAVFDL